MNNYASDEKLVTLMLRGKLLLLRRKCLYFHIFLQWVWSSCFCSLQRFSSPSELSEVTQSALYRSEVNMSLTLFLICLDQHSIVLLPFRGLSCIKETLSNKKQNRNCQYSCLKLSQSLKFWHTSFSKGEHLMLNVSCPDGLLQKKWMTSLYKCLTDFLKSVFSA